MSTQVAYRRDLAEAGCEAGDGSNECGIPPDALEPLLEGARARGLADAYEMIGQAAVLLDGSGGVLHSSCHANRLLGNGLQLLGGHLVGTSADANQALESILARALGGHDPESGQGIRLEADGGGWLRVRALPFKGGQGNPAQMLKAVVLLDLAA